MAFPLSYKHAFEFDNICQVSNKALINRIVSIFEPFNNKTNDITDNKFSFYSNYSFFNFSYQINISVEVNQTVKIEYEFWMFWVLKAILFISVLTPFFSNFSVINFLTFNLIFAIIFYSINFFFIKKYISNKIELVIDFVKNLPQSKINTEKKLANSCCPACGAEIFMHEAFCSDCGLKLSDKKHIVNSTITKYKKRKIKYFIKK